MKSFKNPSKFFKNIFKSYKTKKRILSLIILLFILAFSLGTWSLLSHPKNKKTAQTPENQNQQSSDTSNPTIRGTGTNSPQTETASITQKNTSSKESSQQPNEAANPPAESQNPPPSPTPDNQWCEWHKEQQRQILLSYYQIKISEENARYEQEVNEIDADYQRRGLWDSGRHWEALRQAESSHNTLLYWIDYRYQEDLRKINYSC